MAPQPRCRRGRAAGARAEIRALFAAGEPPSPAYRIGIAEIFPGEDRPHSWAYTLTPVRLYRRDAGRYSAALVHDRVELNAGIRAGHLRGVIHHFSVRSLGDQLDKLNRYSDQQAHDLELRGVAIPTWRLFFEFPANFVKAYVARRHFVRGVYGFLTAMNTRSPVICALRSTTSADGSRRRRRAKRPAKSGRRRPCEASARRSAACQSGAPRA